MTYSAGYVAAWAVAVIGVIAGVLAGLGYTGLHPAWLTQDVSATAGIISAICVGLAAILPQVTRTPATREAQLLAAAGGVLPDDLAAKHPTIAIPQSQAGVPPAG